MAEQNLGLSPAGAAARRVDRERFLAALGCAPTRRDAVFALIAFNGELARARDAAADATLGLIRLQWWRELVEALRAGDAAALGKHEIAPVLAEALRDAPEAIVEAMIDARDADFDPGPQPDLAAFHAYVAATAGGLARLTLRAADGPTALDGPADRAAAAMGLAYGTLGLIRALPFRLRRGRLDLPADLLAAHGVDHSDLRELRPTPQLNAACRELAETARAALAAGRAERAALSGPARAGLLFGVYADSGLRRLASAGFDPFHPASLRPDPWAALRLTLAGWRGRY